MPDLLRRPIGFSRQHKNIVAAGVRRLPTLTPKHEVLVHGVDDVLVAGPTSGRNGIALSILIPAPIWHPPDRMDERHQIRVGFFDGPLLYDAKLTGRWIISSTRHKSIGPGRSFHWLQVSIRFRREPTRYLLRLVKATAAGPYPRPPSSPDSLTGI